jgi:hypothetical protein
MNEAPELNLELPDPERDDISSMEFLARIEEAWAICDRFDLQTEIWRGRILKAVRDRERRGGEGRGTGFLQWLREQEISKTRAYGLIQLAEIGRKPGGAGAPCCRERQPILEAGLHGNGPGRSGGATADQRGGQRGEQITRKSVRRLTDDFTSATSPLLPEEIRQRTADNLLPSKAVAPLVKELSKLPEQQQEDLRRVLRDEPELERVKDVTSTARWLSKAAEAGLAVRAFQQGELNLEKAMQEAQRLDALGLLADAVGQAQQLESAVLELHTGWRRLGGLQERLWVESGSSTPHLRELLNALQEPERQHHAGVPGRAGRRQAGAAAAGGGGARPTGSAAPPPHLVPARVSSV